MRLIDADKLLLKFNEAYDEAYAKYRESDSDSFWGGGCSAMRETIKEIKEQPTAYDVNEVLRQLDEEKKLSYADLDTCSELGPLQEPEDDDYLIIGFKKATKIVKAGGL